MNAPIFEDFDEQGIATRWTEMGDLKKISINIDFTVNEWLERTPALKRQVLTMYISMLQDAVDFIDTGENSVSRLLAKKERS